MILLASGMLCPVAVHMHTATSPQTALRKTCMADRSLQHTHKHCCVVWSTCRHLAYRYIDGVSDFHRNCATSCKVVCVSWYVCKHVCV